MKLTRVGFGTQEVKGGVVMFGSGRVQAAAVLATFSRRSPPPPALAGSPTAIYAAVWQFAHPVPLNAGGIAVAVKVVRVG